MSSAEEAFEDTSPGEDRAARHWQDRGHAVRLRGSGLPCDTGVIRQSKTSFTLPSTSSCDLFDRHYDWQNGCATHFACKVPVTIDTVLNGDFDGHCDGDITCKQISGQNCAEDFQTARYPVLNPLLNSNHCLVALQLEKFRLSFRKCSAV